MGVIYYINKRSGVQSVASLIADPGVVNSSLAPVQSFSS